MLSHLKVVFSIPIQFLYIWLFHDKGPYPYPYHLLCKSIDWFLYGGNLHYERIKTISFKLQLVNQ